MNVKCFLPYLGIAILAFVFGTICGTRWKTRYSRLQDSRSQTSAAVSAQEVEPEWPLTKQIVSRSLQSHSFRTDRLRRNSNDEIVWRWLKESIAGYPQNWVKLNISNHESYGVVVYPPKVLESTELNQFNNELSERGLPQLIKGKRYLPITIYHGDIICPSWSGFIDVEEATLVYFVGMSG
jgi:hypothetical protein